MTPQEERAREFFRLHRPPDAQWFIDEVLIPGLAHVIRAAEAAAREACAGVADQHWERVGRDCGNHAGETCYRETATAIRAIPG